MMFLGRIAAPAPGGLQNRLLVIYADVMEQRPPLKQLSESEKEALISALWEGTNG